MPVSAGGAFVARLVTLGDIAFADVDSTGVQWILTDVAGWDNATGSTLQVTQRLRAPGGWRSTDPQVAARTLSLTGTLVGPADWGVLSAAADRLKSRVTLAQTTLSVQDSAGGVARFMRVSRQGEVLFKPVGDRALSFSISLVAADPRRFAPVVTRTTGLSTSSGGLTLPAAMPWTINAVTVTGSVSLTNPGTVNGPVTVRISGPVVAPVVTHVAADGSVDVFSSSQTLAAGEWLDVDMEAQTVLAQGQASRAQWVTSAQWAGFKPGVNTWAFSAAAYDAGATMQVTVTPSWE